MSPASVKSFNDTKQQEIEHDQMIDVHIEDGETEREAALRLARVADPGIKVFSWRGMQFLFYALMVCMCTGDTGYDGTIMSSVNSMTTFHNYFGIKKAASTGIVFVSDHHRVI